MTAKGLSEAAVRLTGRQKRGYVYVVSNARSLLHADWVKIGSSDMDVGSRIFKITQSLTDDGNLIDIELSAQLIGEPEWKDYGAKAKWKGATTCDLLMEQPFFPVRASADTKISMRLGTTSVFCCGTDKRKGDEGRFVLVFITPRLIEP